MVINRRRAPSSEISSEKKLSGHAREDDFAALIGGEVIHGTQKGDVKDKNGKIYTVKSGKKWQVFLYGYNRIANCIHLKILQLCLDAFPEDYNPYVKDRENCIAYKEKYIRDYGREAAKNLSNDDVAKYMISNKYIEAKSKLAEATIFVCNKLKDKDLLRKFLCEALFDNAEVNFIAIKDSTYKKDGLFRIFDKEDVLDILSEKLFPTLSKAGGVPEDYNVAGQKTLLIYQNTDKKWKNIVEIEIRNDSATHYRQVRFNMYSKDALFLLLNSPQCTQSKYISKNVVAYGRAIKTLLI